MARVDVAVLMYYNGQAVQPHLRFSFLQSSMYLLPTSCISKSSSNARLTAKVCPAEGDLEHNIG